MGFCEFCKKWVKQPEGKRAKRFCNNTCRSNHWYSLNKKGKARKGELKTEVKYTIPVHENYDNPKLSAYIQDEHPMFSAPKPRLTPDQIMRKYVDERRDFTCDEEFKDWFNRLDSDERLTDRQKQLVKATN